MGLLSSIGNSISGLLGTDVMGVPAGAFLGIPQSREQLRIMALGGPEKAAQFDRMKQQQELLQMQMDEAKKSQGRDDITAAMIQSMNLQVADAVQRLRSSLSKNDLAGAEKARDELEALQAPEYQNLLRGHLATQGNIGMAEQAGIIAPPAQQYAPPEIVKTLQAAGIDPASEEGRAIIRQSLERSAGSQGALFAPTIVRNADGTYSAVQFGNQPGMSPINTPLGGAPSYDPSLAGQRAEAVAIGEAAGQASAAAPSEVAMLEDAIGLFGRLSTMPGLASATGPLQGRLPTVNKATADYEALKEQAIATISLAARGQLKGTGAITESEQSQLRAAQTLLADPTISEQMARQEINRVLRWLESKRARKEAMIVPGSSPAQNTSPVVFRRNAQGQLVRVPQ